MCADAARRSAPRRASPAAARARWPPSITARWPRCTPSKLPIATTAPLGARGPLARHDEARGRTIVDHGDGRAVATPSSQARLRWPGRGTDTIASPSSTTLPSTIASQARWTRRALAHQFHDLDDDCDHVADLYRRMEIERLRAVDRARAWQPRAEHRRDQACGVEPMRDALAEPGAVPHRRRTGALDCRRRTGGRTRPRRCPSPSSSMFRACRHAGPRNSQDAQHARVDRIGGRRRYA